jgi:hypothetical protein
VDWWQIVIVLALLAVISVVTGMVAGIPLSRIIQRRRQQVSLSRKWAFLESGPEDTVAAQESEPKDTIADQFDKLFEKYSLSKARDDKQSGEETLEREKDEPVAFVEQAEAAQESEPKDTMADQFDKLFEKYSLSKARDDKQSSEETLEKALERENDESVTFVEQTDPKAKEDKQSSEETLKKALERENDESVTFVEQTDPMLIDQLLAELEKNHALSADPRPDKPEPFQTEIWDANSSVPNILPASLKWELTQAYVDMYLANNIIWFLKEFGVDSPVLGGQYREMCERISPRLGKIIPVVKTGKKIET